MILSIAPAAALAGLVLSASLTPLAAQEGERRSDRVGHVVAIVGDSVLLNFDVQESIIARAASMRQQPPLPGTPEWTEAESAVIEDLVAELLVVQAALKDTTIVVPEDRIAEAVQRQIEQDQRQLGGPVGLDRELRASGRTLEDYRQALTTQYRKRELIRAYYQKVAMERKPPRVTDQEFREVFEQQRANFGKREASITFQRIVVRTEPSEAALADARARADSVFNLLSAGEDFAELARRFSDDGTRENGGDLGFIRRSDVVREFANVAFSLAPGAISGPVRTQYGYHLIKVERIRGAEVQARHILFMPELTDTDAHRARARADSVASRAHAGEDFQALSRTYGDPDLNFRVGPTPVDSLQRMLQTDLSTAQPGDVLGPIPIGGADVATQFLVIRIVEREPEREWRFDDPQLAGIRQQYAQQKLFDEVVEELRRATYVEIRRS